MREYLDIRPDWVKQVLALRPRLIGYPENHDGSGRWSFEPSKENSEQEIGAEEWHYRRSTGQMRPAIWTGEKWIDLHSPEGQELRSKVKEKANV